MATSEQDRILGNPKFQELVRTRSSFAWTLAAVMLAIYLGFIFLVAFAHDLMAMKVGGGVDLGRHRARPRSSSSRPSCSPASTCSAPMAASTS